MITNTLKHDKLIKKTRMALSDISETVGFTYGPNGSNVVYIDNETRFPETTKDGITVLRHIKYHDQLMSTILFYIRNSAMRQEKEIGDGTTTLTLLTAELYKNMSEYIEKENLQKSVARKIFKHVNMILQDFVVSNSIPFNVKEHAYLLAYTSTDGDKDISNIVAKIYEDDETAKINIHFSSASQHNYNKIDGLSIDGTILFKDLVFKDYHIHRLDTNVCVSLVKGYFNPSYSETSNLTEYLRNNEQNLIVVCNDIGEEASRFLSNPASQKLGLTKNIYFVTVQNTSIDYFIELSSLTQAKIIESQDIHSMSIEGRFVDQFMETTVIVEHAVLNLSSITLAGTTRNEPLIQTIIDEAMQKIKLIKEENGDTPQNQPLIEKQKSKIQRLNRKIVNLYIGGDSENTARYNMGLADDAVRTIENAFKYGVIAGMNKSIISISDDEIDSFEEIKPYGEHIKSVMYILRKSYINITKLLSPDSGDEFINDIISGKIRNLREGDNTIPVINNAYTDLVILKNVYDNVIFFMMSAFLGTNPEIAMREDKLDL